MLDFHALYMSYAPEVYRFAYWLAGDLAEAEDVTSETFIRAWTHIGTIRTETLKAYLLQIARNVYLERRRKHKREIRLMDIYPDSHPDPAALAEDHAELALVQSVLQVLPEIDRSAFILRVQQELPYDEIARVLGLSATAVKVKVHRARRKMLAARMYKEAV